MNIAQKSGACLGGTLDLNDAAKEMSQSKPPDMIKYRKDGKYHRVTDRIWDDHRT